MNKEEALRIFSSIVESTEPEVLISDLLGAISDLEEDTIKDLIDQIKTLLFSKKKTTTQKLQVIRTLKSLMQTKSPIIITQVHKRLIQYFPDMIILKNTSTGFDLWSEVLKVKDKSEFKFIILVLQCIERWGELHGNDCKGKETMYSKVYQQLKSRKIEFPPSFFLQPLSCLPRTYLKRDLHRVRKLTKEFIRSIRLMDKQNVLLLKKILNTYEKVLQFEIEDQSSEIKVLDEGVILTLMDLEEAKKLFHKWKSANFDSLPEEGIFACVGLLIEDPVPKEEPLDEEEGEGGGKPRAGVRPKSPSKIEKKLQISKCFFGIQSELGKLKEKNVELENLVEKHKADFIKSQNNYLSVIDERDILMHKVDDLSESNQILEKSLIESRFLVEELTRKKNYLQKDIEAYYDLNKIHKALIEELQETRFHLEKEISHNKNHIETIENANALLVATNQTLRSELERSKTYKQMLSTIPIKRVENRFPTSLPLGLMHTEPAEAHSQSIASFSELEVESISSSEEDDKQMTNFAVKFNPQGYLFEAMKISGGCSEDNYSRT